MLQFAFSTRSSAPEPCVLAPPFVGQGFLSDIPHGVHSNGQMSAPKIYLTCGHSEATNCCSGLIQIQRCSRLSKVSHVQ